MYFKDEKLKEMCIDSLRDELKSAQTEKLHNERATMFYTVLLLSILGLMVKHYDMNIIILSSLICIFMFIVAGINIYLSKKYNNYKDTIIQLINTKDKS